MEGLECGSANGLELGVGDADAILGALLSSASKGEGRRTALGASDETVGRRQYSWKALSAAAPMGLNSGSVMRMRYSAPSCQVQAKVATRQSGGTLLRSGSQWIGEEAHSALSCRHKAKGEREDIVIGASHKGLERGHT